MLLRVTRNFNVGIRSFWRGMTTERSLFASPWKAPPIHPQRRVVVTGLGLVTPLGVGVDYVWQALLSGGTGVRKLQPEDMPESHRSSLEQLPSQVVACVPKDQLYSVAWAVTGVRYSAPFTHFALLATAEALEDAGWAPSTCKDKRATGVAIGAGMSSTADMADAGILVSNGKLRKLSPYFIPRILVNTAAGAVSIAHGFQGPNHAVATACATGAHSIGDAYRMIQRGDADVMVAGGTESCVDAISMGGFGRLKALSTHFNDCPERASRPFDKDRDGFVLGEGAGTLILEELEHAVMRGAPRIYAEIRGYGMSGDAHHITQPPPDGSGAMLAMEKAVKAAGLTPGQVEYVNAHATSTPLGDDVEQRAISNVFGDGVAVSSTKGATGHLLGAAGAVEAAFTVLALWHRKAPMTLNLEIPDPPILKNLIRSEPLELPAGHIAAVSNSFGFGGVNASICFATAPER